MKTRVTVESRIEQYLSGDCVRIRVSVAFALEPNKADGSTCSNTTYESHLFLRLLRSTGTYAQTYAQQRAKEDTWCVVEAFLYQTMHLWLNRESGENSQSIIIRREVERGEEKEAVGM